MDADRAKIRISTFFGSIAEFAFAGVHLIKMANKLLVVALLVLAVSLYVRQVMEESQFKAQWALPFFMLWGGDREALAKVWEERAPINTDIVYEPMAVPEIDAKDFSFENMREATQNFRRPAVVRGLFNGTRALSQWTDPEYLSSLMGDVQIPIVRNAVVGTLQDDRVVVNFGDAFKSLLAKDYAKEYLFFPVKSRFTFPGSEAGSAEALQKRVDEICRADLDFDRIWKGFGTKAHTTYVGSQFVIGKSTPTFSNESTGSDWHCAPGNNWFIQAAGQKYWEFIEPKYSAYMHPLKGGLFNMWTGNKRIKDLQKHIPRWSCTLRAGDMVYNPHWMWHKIINYGGLSIGIPVRESNHSLSLRNNAYFTGIVITGKVLNLMGLSLGGYPPPSAATEADN